MRKVYKKLDETTCVFDGHKGTLVIDRDVFKKFDNKCTSDFKLWLLIWKTFKDTKDKVYRLDNGNIVVLPNDNTYELISFKDGFATLEQRGYLYGRHSSLW